MIDYPMPAIYWISQWRYQRLHSQECRLYLNRLAGFFLRLYPQPWPAIFGRHLMVNCRTQIMSLGFTLRIDLRSSRLAG